MPTIKHEHMGAKLGWGCFSWYRRREGDGNWAADRKEKRLQKAAELRRRVAYYERGTFWGRPSAVLLFQMAVDLNMEDTHLLW